MDLKVSSVGKRKKNEHEVRQKKSIRIGCVIIRVLLHPSPEGSNIGRAYLCILNSCKYYSAVYLCFECRVFKIQRLLENKCQKLPLDCQYIHKHTYTHKHQKEHIPKPRPSIKDALEESDVAG